MLAEFIIYHFNLQEHGYTWVVLVVLLLVFFGAYWLLNKSPVSEWFKSSEDVVPPFLALPAIMFALFISALATDIWQKHYDAKQALIREASALRSVILLAPNLGERGQYLSQATENYINAVIDREWQAMMLKDHPNKESALPELEALDFNIAKIGSDPSLPQYVAIRLSCSGRAVSNGYLWPMMVLQPRNGHHRSCWPSSPLSPLALSTYDGQEP